MAKNVPVYCKTQTVGACMWLPSSKDPRLNVGSNVTTLGNIGLVQKRTGLSSVRSQLSNAM